MMNRQFQDRPSGIPPALAQLGLTRENIVALSRQGFLSAEYRITRGKRYGPYVNLRW